MNHKQLNTKNEFILVKGLISIRPFIFYLKYMCLPKQINKGWTKIRGQGLCAEIYRKMDRWGFTQEEMADKHRGLSIEKIDGSQCFIFISS